MTPVSAPQAEQLGIAAMLRVLDGAEATPSGGPGVCTLVGPSGEATPIPESIFYVLERVAEVMARGDSVTVIPVGKELTTQQAADLLNISRQYLVRLLNDEQLPYSKTGKHRRIKMQDVVAFKKQRDRSRLAGLDELTRLSEDSGGYDELK